MNKKLSLRARGVLAYFINADMSISAVRLAEEVAEGRDAILTALKELRESGLIVTRKERVNNEVKTVSYVTEKGFVEAASWGLKSRTQIQHSEQNSLIQVLANSAINVNKVTIDERLETKMGYEFFNKTSNSNAEEREAERLKAEATRKKEYQEAKAAYHSEQSALVEQRTPEKWTVKQSILEFSQRMSDMWNISPWSMSGSRFFEAYGFNRKKYETNGKVELEMMDIFFNGLRDKEIDGNKVWKVFIARFSELSAHAKLRISSPEIMETAKAQADEQWKKIFGEDFDV
jgi:flagellar biosynthesis GTPase FlhF